MTKNTYQPISKPLGYRVQELIQSLEVIRDSLDAVRVGKLHQLIPVYGQLRALLSEKSKGNYPLLLDVANAVGFDLEIYCMTGAGDLPEELKQHLLLHLSGFPATVEQVLPGQQKLAVEEFLDQKILIYNERSYQAKDIIAFFANKAGGAHYSPDLPKDFAELLSFHLSGNPVLVNALLQIADLTYKLAVRLLKSQADSETHLLILVPPQELAEAAYVFDNQYPDSHMRIFCRIDPGMKLAFGATGIQGATAVARIDRLIDWSKLHHFTLSLTFEQSLSTRLAVSMDGEQVSSLVVDHPLFVVNDPLHYDSYQNRSHDDEHAGLSMGFVEMAMYGRDLPPKEQAQLFLYFDEKLSKQDQKCVFFRRGQYGNAAPGTKNMQMTNSPVMWSVSKLLDYEYPPESGASAGEEA
jgi:hypothetical protein